LIARLANIYTIEHLIGAEHILNGRFEYKTLLITLQRKPLFEIIKLSILIEAIKLHGDIWDKSRKCAVTHLTCAPV